MPRCGKDFNRALLAPSLERIAETRTDVSKTTRINKFKTHQHDFASGK
jgi:hypothetical protein